MADLSDYDLACLCNALYRPPWPSGYWNNLWSNEACYVAHKTIGDTDIVVPRGSDDIVDWFNDFNAGVYYDPALGPVHCGFWEPLKILYPQIKAVLKAPKRIIVGHSLGASRACLLGAQLAIDGMSPELILTMGCPRPGFKKLADILAPIPIRAYKNLSDPVTDVPAFLAHLNQLYVEPRPFIAISAQPSPFDMWDVLHDHHCALYVSGIAKLFGQV